MSFFREYFNEHGGLIIADFADLGAISEIKSQKKFRKAFHEKTQEMPTNYILNVCWHQRRQSQ